MPNRAEEANASGADPVRLDDQPTGEFARLNRAVASLCAANRTLLRAENEQDLLQNMCRVIVDSGGYRLACVAYAEHDEAKSVHLMAAAGMDRGLPKPFNFTWDDSEWGGTAIGSAIRTGAPVGGRNLLTDPAYAGPAFAVLRQGAIENGYACVMAFPLRVDGAVLGALAIAAAETDAFDEREVSLLSELADALAYGIATLRARSRHQAAEATIARMAYYDALTGLPNRILLLQKVEEAIAAARQPQRALALLYLEVRHVGEINQVFGYRAGDELLLAVGRRLAQALTDDATVARIGDAAFAILLPNGGAEEAIEVAQRLIATLQQPVEVSGVTVDSRVSIGIALAPGHATDADAMVRRANAAMHQTRRPRSGYALYVGGQEQENARRLALMGDLGRAIEDDHLRLYCQPKLNIASRCVCGAEALVRWEHPQLGMISTTEFIDLAEQAGLIGRLTNWMLQAAFRQSYAWRKAGIAQALAVNLSAHDLYDPGLIERIRGLFSTWGIEPGLIQFELTESALMADPADAMVTLARLKRLNVRLFVDDFGTGYSSLSYLQKLPVDGLKVDKSFVMPMVTSSDSAVIVRSTVELGHNLGLEVVAEGVESDAIMERLAGLGCDVAQGHLISRPIPAEQFGEWCARWQQTAG